MDWHGLWRLFSTLVTIMVMGRLIMNTALDCYGRYTRRRKR